MAWFTYLVPNSQDFFNGFPHEKYAVIALAKVHPGLEVRAFNVLVGSHGDNFQAVRALKLILGRHCSPGHSAHRGILRDESLHRDLA